MENIPSAHRRPKFRLEEMSRVSLLKFTIAFGVSFLVCVVVVEFLLKGVEANGQLPMIIYDGSCYPNCGFGEPVVLPPTDDSNSDSSAGDTPAPPDTEPPTPTPTPTLTLEADNANRDIATLGEGRTAIPIDEMSSTYLIQNTIDKTTMSHPFVYRLTFARKDGTSTRGLLEEVEFKTILEPPPNSEKRWDKLSGKLECPTGSEGCYMNRKLQSNPDEQQFFFSITDIPDLHEDCSIVDSFSVFFEYRKTEFIKTEVGVRYVFVVFSVFLSAAFYYKIAFGTQRYPWKAWALEQKWTFILLALLVGFNNPLCLSESQPLYVFIDYALLYTFLIGYMLAILSMTDHMAQSARKSTNLFYGPKIALCGPLWVVLVGCAYSYKNDPDLLLENPLAVAFISIMLALYILWLFALIAIMIQKVSNSKTTSLHVSLRFKAVWSLNLLMLAAVAAALYRSSSWETGGNRDEFLLGYIGFNLYVAILAALFIPAESSMPYRPPPPQPTPQADVIINDEYEVEGDYE
eukprot:TRINITY_DN6404_c0_g1_i1.p1 TRINITY_DN6404_c0_g1~~TRINITY_DN6404_c0_g1_i1.p1  ORF type:complete len:518 (+),score=71.15 TRINITY_DN6404_c0_g1_i1:1175-2728(+)